MPCANFTELPHAIDSSRISELREPVLKLSDELKRRHGVTYFPFTRYGEGIRAAQAYLTKFPAELIGLLPELADTMVAPGPLSPSGHSRKGAGRLHDPVLRKAIEDHAVAAAKRHYMSNDETEVDVLGKPYDLLVRGPAGERHVEVKGSSLRIDKVLLTVNEVLHARAHEATDLFVVDEIEWQLQTDGMYTTSGGRERIWRSWSPQDERLSALQYQYELGEVEP